MTNDLRTAIAEAINETFEVLDFNGICYEINHVACADAVLLAIENHSAIQLEQERTSHRATIEELRHAQRVANQCLDQRQ